MKCSRGPSRRTPSPGTPWSRELGQRLAAEARSAGAEDDDIARAGAQPACSGADRGEILARGRQAQERQAAVGMARAQPVERLAAASERVIERSGRDALGADALFARGLDGLDEGHRVVVSNQGAASSVRSLSHPNSGYPSSAL